MNSNQYPLIYIGSVLSPHNVSGGHQLKGQMQSEDKAYPLKTVKRELLFNSLFARH